MTKKEAVKLAKKAIAGYYKKNLPYDAILWESILEALTK